MHAVDRGRRGARQSLQSRARDQLHLMGEEVARVIRRFVVVLVGAEALGLHILEERSARRDVQDLEAATEAEHRHAILQRPSGELQLHHVARRIGVPQQRVPRLAEGRRLDVHPARQQQPAHR